MKKATHFFALMLLTIVTNSAYSQINSAAMENKLHESISSSISSAKQQALTIGSDPTKSIADKLKSTEDVLKKLETVKQSHESLKNSTAGIKKNVAQDASALIEKNHAISTKYASELKAELQKPLPDNTKVSDLSTKLSSSLNELETAHQLLKGTAK